MNERNILFGILIFVVVSMGGMIAYDMKTNKKMERLLGNNRSATNWEWSNDWQNSPHRQEPRYPQQQRPNIPQVAPVIPNTPSVQLTAPDYNAALQMSAREGKPILVFFTADWCTWCKKMKNEVVTQPKVQAIMKNYILVYVDTDQNKQVSQKYGVQFLPAYVITNSKEEKLKVGDKYKAEDAFAEWLNNPTLFNQPKEQPQARPQQQPPVQPQGPIDRLKPRNQMPRSQPGC